jgi:hypothetical protein
MTLPVPESWFVLALAYFPTLVLAVIWHEAGHLIGARLVRAPVAAWGVGLARPHFSFPLAGTRFYFGRPYSGGLTLVIPEIFATKRRRRAAIFIAAGPLASLVGMVGGYFIWEFACRSDLLATWVIISATLVLATCFPFRIKHGKLNLASDAWQLIDLARDQRKGRLQPVGETLGTLTAVSELLRRIGSEAEADYYQLLAGLPRCDLSDFTELAEAQRIRDRLPAGRFPEAQQVYQLIEAEVLVGTDDPRAAEFLEAARAQAANVPNLEYLLFVLQSYYRIRRGEYCGQELQARLEEAHRHHRSRVCTLELLGFLANPPQRAAVACQKFLVRHRREITEIQRVQLLTFVTELLTKREEYAAARENFHAALAAIAAVSRSIQDLDVRRRFTLAASVPLQRAMLINSDEMPLFISETAEGGSQIEPKFAKFGFNLGFACLGLVCSAYIIKAVAGRPLPEGLSPILSAITVACWIAVWVALIGAAFRKEARQTPGLVGLIVATVAVLLLAGVASDSRPRPAPAATSSFELIDPGNQAHEDGFDPASD